MESVLKQNGTFKSFDGTEIYFESRGSGSPMILIYGIACLTNHWHHQVEHFSKNHQVITFDLRGHHKSSSSPELQNLTIAAMADDISALLEHLNIKQAHFVGHSFGAPVILETYKKYPELFKSLVFIADKNFFSFFVLFFKSLAYSSLAFI